MVKALLSGDNGQTWYALKQTVDEYLEAFDMQTCTVETDERGVTTVTVQVEGVGAVVFLVRPVEEE